jgi:predicted RNA-binding protein Jag
MSDTKGLFSLIKDWISPKAEPIVAPKIDWPLPVQDQQLVKTSPEVGAASDALKNYAITVLETWLSASGFGGKVVFAKQEKEALFFEVIESEDVGRVIGKDGMTLDALQVLLKAAIYKKFEGGYKIYIDIENYRQKREDSLKAQALKASKYVLTRARKVDLKPMNPEERRLIHALFQQDKRIRSYSVGTGVYRHVVLERRGPAVVLDDTDAAL